LALASYARCAPRICIIDSTIETFECSSIPNASVGPPRAPGAIKRAGPEASVRAKSVAPSGRSASGAAKLASRSRAIVRSGRPGTSTLTRPSGATRTVSASAGMRTPASDQPAASRTLPSAWRAKAPLRE
jgi:hypothetical protein